MLLNTEEAFKEYINLFVQPVPYFGIKSCKERSTWKIKKETLRYNLVRRHLDQKICISTLGKWYPSYGIIDIDHREFSDVEIIRETLGFNESNSMLYNSETPGNYHILFRPLYRNNNATLKLFSDIMKPVVQKLGCEIYPQKNKPIRLPFGYNQRGADYGLELLSWEDSVYWFNKIDTFDLINIREKPDFINYNYNPDKPSTFNLYLEGRDLLETGLNMPSSRHKSQFAILYYYFQNKYHQENAEDLTLQWIKNKHNGYSTTANSYGWDRIGKEISRQASYIWNNYTHYLNQDTYKKQYGIIIKSDLVKILKVTEGKFSLMQFLYKLIRYYQPKQNQGNTISLHSNTLIEWSSRNTYQKFLYHLEKKGIIKQEGKYIRGLRAKTIIINWEYDSTVKPIQYNGKTPEDITTAIKIGITKEELKLILKSIYLPASRIKVILAKIY